MNFESINELKKKFPNDAEALSGLWRDYQEADAMADIANHPGISKLLALYKTYIEAINAKLLADNPMDEHERDLLLAERRAYSLMQQNIDSANTIKESNDKLIQYAQEK